MCNRPRRNFAKWASTESEDVSTNDTFYHWFGLSAAPIMLCMYMYFNQSTSVDNTGICVYSRIPGLSDTRLPTLICIAQECFCVCLRTMHGSPHRVRNRVQMLLYASTIGRIRQIKPTKRMVTFRKILRIHSAKVLIAHLEILILW